ncbi:MAG: hypothetical protein WD181_03185 [Solirubrobacterales bacterium]
MSSLIEFTLHAKPGHYEEVARLYGDFAKRFQEKHPSDELILLVGDPASGLVRGIGVLPHGLAEAVNSDDDFAAFNDSVADLIAAPPERVELELLEVLKA